MKTGLWVAFWIAFSFFSLTKFRPVFWIAFCGILILMRIMKNQIPQDCWVAFWLSLLHIYPDLLRQIEPQVLSFWVMILYIIRFFITSAYEMPTAAFYVLNVLLIPAASRSTLGVFVHNAVVIFNFHLETDGIRLPGLSIKYWISMLILVILCLVYGNLKYPKFLPANLLWLVSIGVLHNQMWPYNENFGVLWIGAWFLSFHAMMLAFSPDMPWLWYPLLGSIVVGLGFGFRPDKSLKGFVLWAITIIMVRIVLFCVYIFYILNSDTADFFPFNLFSHKWKLSKQRWFSLKSRPLDSLNNTSLCEKCDMATRESKLIMGSSSYLTYLVEWHDFWSRNEFTSWLKTPGLEQGDIEESPALFESSCHLCCLIWHSLSPRRQNQIRPNVQPTGDTQPEDFGLPRPSDAKAELRVKIWEERPLSLYTYMQLFWGETAVGARLLIHRDGQFTTPSAAIKHSKMNSPSHFEQARSWLKMCKDGHRLCRGVGNTKLELPARMLYVTGGKDWIPGSTPETLKLVRTIEIDPNAEYLALSHCWGPPAEMRFKLLASNIDRCYESIDYTGLSQNMQDAITTTVSLGFSFIWIDSLCIIQWDDKGEEVGETAEIFKADWETEARKMGSVYSGAACTIASTGSSTSTGGCFHSRSPMSLKPCKVGVSSLDALSPHWIYARQDDVLNFELNVDQAPLNTRGWVMQERLLSRRILHFGAEMMYWECCIRSASELYPRGYTYKRFPEDFEDNYSPDLKGHISTRGELQKAERQGRGIRWANIEAVRLRPPPVITAPDSSLTSQVVWQQKRGFWRNVLKSNDGPWVEDESDGNSSHTRAGFRAAFEQLRSGSPNKEERVGRGSASQLWYDMVELYSRGKLTSPTDKLIALKGVEDEVARARNLTYLHGLWKEQLPTDLLWFAIEGPGRRLLNREGIPVAPTWSWASIEAIVALDLLPDTSLADIEETETLVTVHELSPSSDYTGNMKITLSGPLLPISAPVFDGTSSTWTLGIGETGKASAQFFPDVKEPDVCQMSGLACITFLVLDREKRKSLIPSSSEDVQGLVLRLVNLGAGERTPSVYERVGYFTTSYIKRSRAARKGRKALKKAPKTTLYLTDGTDAEATRSA